MNTTYWIIGGIVLIAICCLSIIIGGIAFWATMENENVTSSTNEGDNISEEQSTPPPMTILPEDVPSVIDPIKGVWYTWRGGPDTGEIRTIEFVAADGNRVSLISNGTPITLAYEKVDDSHIRIPQSEKNPIILDIFMMDGKVKVQYTQPSQPDAPRSEFYYISEEEANMGVLEAPNNIEEEILQEIVPESNPSSPPASKTSLLTPFLGTWYTWHGRLDGGEPRLLTIQASNGNLIFNMNNQRTQTIDKYEIINPNHIEYSMVDRDKLEKIKLTLENNYLIINVLESLPPPPTYYARTIELAKQKKEIIETTVPESKPAPPPEPAPEPEIFKSTLAAGCWKYAGDAGIYKINQTGIPCLVIDPAQYRKICGPTWISHKSSTRDKIMGSQTFDDLPKCTDNS